MPTTKCAARGCKSNNKNCEDTLFRFPVDENRAKAWVLACRRDDLVEKCTNLHSLSYRVCALHFEPHMFTSGLRNRLRSGSIPTIFPEQEGSSSSKDHEMRDVQDNRQDWKMELTDSPSGQQTQTTQVLSINTSRIQKLPHSLKISKNKVSKLESQVKDLQERLADAKSLQTCTLEDLDVLIGKFCPRELTKLIMVQIRQAQKKIKGWRYTKEFKRFCLKMYFHCPKLYKRVLANIFSLPSVNTLAQSIKNLNLCPGINPLVFETLKQKVSNFRDIDKLCILCFDKMNIKANLFYESRRDEIIGCEDVGVDRNFKPALAATVIMARGLYCNWKQPLAFFFVNTTLHSGLLKSILEDIIQKLSEIDVTVVALTCEMGSNNMQVAKLLNISPETPYFYHADKKIVFLYDIPHLLRALRNNLLKYICYLNHFIVSWEFIKKLYEHDKTYATRALPKLTDIHISPNSFEKMKNKYALDIFSRSVFAVMQLYIRFQVLPPEAETTANFIMRINDLYDILNSSSTEGFNFYQQPYRGTKEQKQFLLECIDLFDNLEFFNHKGEPVTNKIKCLRGWKITINGILHLWDILQPHGVEFLLTRRIHQDALNNVFDSIREICGNKFTPTSIQFLRAFRQLFSSDMLNSEAGFCAKDEDQDLFSFLDFDTSHVNVATCHEITIPKTTFQSIDTDYRYDTTLKDSFTKYICGYLLRKCISKHTCPVCQDYAKTTNTTLEDDSSLYFLLKAYKHNIELDMFGRLNRPHQDFVQFVTCMEILFQTNFEHLAKAGKIVGQLMDLFKEIKYSHPCKDFPYLYILRLYARVRVFYTLKFVNTHFSSINKDRKTIVWKNV